VRIVDLNVLLYAVNSDAPHHERVREWWEAAVNYEDPIGLPWLVLLGFLRLATSPRVFPRPLTTGTAAMKLDTWLAQDNIRIVREKDDHWPTLKSLLQRSGTAGNLTTDAHLAALAITHDAVLVSCDTDFARFKGLRWENPLA
jgi:toxin-antitoxin system PIN domain toxin